MKALSLWQPWASLIAIGAKKYETRHWSTSYRGPLLIHAAKKCTRELFNTAISDPFLDYLKDAGYKRFTELPFGAFVCVVDLVEIIRTENIVTSLGDHERAFGNYQPGRFAWKLENVRIFPEPLLARGYQGLWNPLGGVDLPTKKLIERLYQ